MNTNYILFLVACLNLLGDLYSIFKFRSQLPRWIPILNLASLAACGGTWLAAPDIAGFIAVGILTVYICSIKFYGRSRATSTPVAATATKVLIAINLLSFALQVAFGATNDRRGFIELGALYTPLLESGQWWRLVTAQFLHWGALHLLFNMMGLWFLGPIVEKALGFMRFIGAYLACGVGGMAIAVGYRHLFDSDSRMLMLGASASVLGLVGLQAAIAVKALRRSSSPFAKAQLAAMIQIVVLQGIFDFLVPEVSSTAHLGGAAVGFLLGMLLTIRPRVHLTERKGV